MASRADIYREELRQLDNWEPYLKKHSGLPGPRANLELVAAVAEEADADRLWRLSGPHHEVLALCGTARPCRVALLAPAPAVERVAERAFVPRGGGGAGGGTARPRLRAGGT